MRSLTARRFFVATIVAGAVAGAGPFIALTARADAPPATAPNMSANATFTQAQATVDKSFDWFKKRQQPDFTWQGKYDNYPAISAMVLKSFLLDDRYNADIQFLDQGYDALIKQQKDTGGIYTDALANYNTAISVSALAVAHEAEYAEPLNKALKYLRSLQWGDDIDCAPSLKVPPTDFKYGGTGYGKGGGRPDLSNLQTTLDALHDAGVKPSDPAFQMAIKFVTRCQNDSETNDQSFASDDGGFIYTPANGGTSPAGSFDGPNGKKIIRSYGSMTYAGLKSMIYAGLGKDDPRVKAAWNWIRNNYTVKINPGMEFSDPTNPSAGLSGVFYYYHTMARALHAYGEPIITDSKGVKHDWREDLVQQLASLQQPDGSFVNTKDKWMESSPTICTAYAALALEEIMADLKEHP